MSSFDLVLERASQATIDIATHIVKVKSLGLPNTSRELFDLLLEHNIISEKCSQQMKGMVGFGNIAVHDYQNINLAIVAAIAEELDWESEDDKVLIKRARQRNYIGHSPAKEFNDNRLNATEYLFTYGTLQQEDIQLTVFSRTLSGFNDVLLGYKLSDEKVVGIYPVMHRSEEPTDLVNGRVYMCSNKEILEADKYEGPAYKRIKVVLNSGKTAWAYISSTQQPN